MSSAHIQSKPTESYSYDTSNYIGWTYISYNNSIHHILPLTYVVVLWFWTTNSEVEFPPFLWQGICRRSCSNASSNQQVHAMHGKINHYLRLAIFKCSTLFLIFSFISSFSDTLSLFFWPARYYKTTLKNEENGTLGMDQPWRSCVKYITVLCSFCCLTQTLDALSFHLKNKLWAQSWCCTLCVYILWHIRIVM